jgi:putative transposase
MDAKLMKKAEELAQEVAGQATTLDELNGVMRSLMKTALEKMLNAELEVHLGRGSSAATAALATAEQPATVDGAEPLPQPRNRKNGFSPKTIQGDAGKLPLEIPRDRNGTFEPQLIGKHQRRLAGFDEKILALYAKGLTTRDIQDIVKELYGVEVSPTLRSGNHDRSRRRGQNLADAAAGSDLADRVPGRHCRPHSRRAPTEGWSRACERTHDVRRNRREFRGKEGTPGPLAA